MFSDQDDVWDDDKIGRMLSRIQQENNEEPVFLYLYKERHQVEVFFLKLKEFRRVATRYDKRADRFLAFVHLACIRILLA